MKKKLQKTTQVKFRIGNVIKRKGDNCMSNGKDMIIHLIVGLIKKTLYKNESILPEILTLKLIFQIMQQKLI